MANIGIIGAGSWGIALSILLYNNGNKVTVWSVIEDEIKMLNEKREHERCLPGVKLPDDMVFTTDLEHTIKNADFLVLAVPSVYTRSTSKSMSGYVREGQIVLDVGINVNEEGKLCGDVVFDEVENIVDAITPVPGGVGSVTTSVLVKHVVDAAARQNNLA